MTNDQEHIWLSDLRKHPMGEVRLHNDNGNLVSGTYPYQVTQSIVEMLQAARADAFDEGVRSGKSRAMRHMSDEPGLSLDVPNPYRRG